VAEGTDGDAGAEIQVGLPGVIPHARALAADKRDRKAGVGGKDVAHEAKGRKLAGGLKMANREIGRILQQVGKLRNFQHRHDTGGAENMDFPAEQLGDGFIADRLVDPETAEPTGEKKRTSPGARGRVRRGE
jgi:hypothetical protein